MCYVVSIETISWFCRIPYPHTHSRHLVTHKTLTLLVHPHHINTHHQSYSLRRVRLSRRVLANLQVLVKQWVRQLIRQDRHPRRWDSINYVVLSASLIFSFILSTTHSHDMHYLSISSLYSSSYSPHLQANLRHQLQARRRQRRYVLYHFDA